LKRKNKKSPGGEPGLNGGRRQKEVILPVDIIHGGTCKYILQVAEDFIKKRAPVTSRGRRTKDREELNKESKPSFLSVNCIIS